MKDKSMVISETMSSLLTALMPGPLGRQLIPRARLWAAAIAAALSPKFEFYLQRTFLDPQFLLYTHELID